MGHQMVTEAHRQEVLAALPGSAALWGTGGGGAGRGRVRGIEEGGRGEEGVGRGDATT